MLDDEINEIIKQYKEYVENQNNENETNIYYNICYELQLNMDIIKRTNEEILNKINDIKNRINISEEEILQMIDID